MKNIYLVCAAGLSTSIMVEKMTEEAKVKNFECKIEAVGVSCVENIIEDADCILLGPQVRFEFENIKKIAGSIPVGILDMIAYGRMDGKSKLKTAQELLK